MCSCADEDSCTVLGGGIDKQPSQALTLWTVFLGVDSGGGSGKHSTAGPMGQKQPSVGRNGLWRGSVSPGRNPLMGLGVLLSGKAGKSQPRGQGHFDPKHPS